MERPASAGLAPPSPADTQSAAVDARSDARKPQSSVDQIYRDIVVGLYEGRFVPGQRLVENDLASLYEVGRSTVRETLKRLAAEGIVEINMHRGANIRQLTRDDTRGLLTVLEVLIGLAARLSAERVGHGHNAEMFRASFDHLMSFEQKSDSYEFVQARNRFYGTIVEISGNRELGRVMTSLHVHLLRVQVRQHQMESLIDRFEDYRQIGEAVLAGNARRAELVGRRHVRRVASALERLSDRLFAPAGSQ